MGSTMNTFPEPPEFALAILRTLQAHGHQAVFAGGCVRDALLGKAPHDWDIATSAKPDEVEALFPRTVGVGKQFGIVCVVAPDGVNYEVATFRGEGKYRDGRHPDSVHFVDMEADVQRRDFTVNALLYDPIAGRLHDFVGGEADLRARVLRAVGDPSRRFAEDKLRVLRAVRFAANLDFEVEPGTWAAMGAVVPELKRCLSVERIASEFEKMLLAGHSQAAFGMLERSAILAELLPPLAACIGCEQPPQFHPEGDVWQHELKLLGFWDGTWRRCMAAPEDAPRFDEEHALLRATPSELRALAWGALLHDIGKPPTFERGADRIHFNGHDVVGAEMAEAVLLGLKLPTEVVENAAWLVRHHMGVTAMTEARLATRRRKLQEPRFPLLLELVRLDSLASFGGLETHDEVVAMWEEEERRPRPPKPTLNGHDLLALGLKPGPFFGQVLGAAADRELEEPFPDRETALAWLREYLAAHPELQ